MSEKKVSVSDRINKLNNFRSNTRTSGPLQKRLHDSNGIFLNKKIGSSESDLNTAFLINSPLSKQTPPISKFKSKSSTAINACYTPSSLYRLANTTPTTLRTPRKFIGTPKRQISSSKKSEENDIDKTPECFSKVKIYSARKFANLSDEENKASNKESEISNLKVAVRVRPLNTQECLNRSVSNIVTVKDEEIIIHGNLSSDSAFGTKHSFFYDKIFWSCNADDPNYADQSCVFNGTGLPLIETVFQGYNACLFAYGQTGSGKSYSMMGIENDEGEDTNASVDVGIIPRFCKEVFNHINREKNKLRAEVEISYFEIYNEKIHDLLSVASISNKTVDCGTGNYVQKNALKVREHPIWGPYVVDLSSHPVDNYTALRNWLALGNSQRATAATGMNDKSSRSHSIFNIILNLSEIETTNEKNKIKQTKRSKISFVDLAGSERISNTSANGDRIREGVSINKSLLTLGKVIAALAESKKGLNFVPYRESILTWLLRENLGGNSKTVMLATISPANIHLEETLATLRYACQARSIVNRVKINEDPHDKEIRELRAEIERLQTLRQEYERQKKLSSNENLPPRKIIIETSVDDSEIEMLRQQLSETEKQLAKAEKSWMERLKEAEDLRKSEVRILKRKGLAIELSRENKEACLINLAADPILSGTLFYILPPGKVLIGRSAPSAFTQPDIVLDGPLVAFEHCLIRNEEGNLYVIPENPDFETYLNGELVQYIKQMYHGDRLSIGGSHYFRISNPFCVNRNENVTVDYQLAYQEVLQKQEEKLRKEIEKEKKAALDQIEMERLINEKALKEQVEKIELEKVKLICTKELLESEKKAFEQEQCDKKYEYTPFKSTILDEIRKIMERPTADSLHEIQLKVKEATRRCRDIGLRYDFRQFQVLDEFGIFRAVISIIDKDNLRKAEWPTARLDVWLDIMRQDASPEADNVFKHVDIEWIPLDENFDEKYNDSINSSKISLNLSAVKEALFKESSNKKISKMLLKEHNKENLINLENINDSFSSNKNVRKTLTYDDDDIETSLKSTCIDIEQKFSSNAYMYLSDMQRSTLKLKKLCERAESKDNYDKKKQTFDHFKRSIDKIENIIYDLKATLTEQKLSISPTKTPKSVRFLLD